MRLVLWAAPVTLTLMGACRTSDSTFKTIDAGQRSPFRVYLKGDSLSPSQQGILTTGDFADFSSDSGQEGAKPKAFSVQNALDQLHENDLPAWQRLMRKDLFADPARPLTLHFTKDSIALQKGGKPGATVPIKRDKGRPYIQMNDLADAFENCAVDSEWLKTHELVRWVVGKAQLNQQDLKVETYFYAPRSYWDKNQYTISGTCFVDISDQEKIVTVASRLSVTFPFDQAPFDLPDEHSGRAFVTDGESVIHPATRRTVTANFSIAQAGNQVIVSRLDLARKLGINDLTDLDGKPFPPEYKAVLQDTVKALVRQLREELPELGHALVLASEDASVDPVISFQVYGDDQLSGISDCATSNVDGMAFACRVILTLGGPTTDAFIEGLKKVGVVSNNAAELMVGMKYLIYHEFGHALGLRHNFKGIKVDQQGKVRQISVMSYPIGLPLDFIAYEPKYHQHDILSLKYLYADFIDKNPSLLRAKLIEELSTMEFATDMDDSPEISDRNGWVLDFIKQLKSERKNEALKVNPKLLEDYKKLLDASTN